MEHKHLACGDTGDPAWYVKFYSTGETPARPTGRMPVLHNPLAQELVFSG
jgi:hypothetical protein